MLIINPRQVRFGSVAWDHVALIAIDRAAARLVEEWSDAGPHATLVDVPEQRLTIKVVQELARDDPGSPRPGEAGELAFFASPGADAARRRFVAPAVVRDVAHEVSLRRGAVRTITLIATSPDGAADPITITDAADGSV